MARRNSPGKPQEGPEKTSGPSLPEGAQKSHPGASPNGPEAPKKEPPIFDDLGPNVPSFETYFLDHVENIKEVQNILAKSLDDHPGVMDEQARETEQHYGAMRSILAWADSYLDVAEHKALRKIGPREFGWTDLDREKALAAAVARERRFRDVVLGIVVSIEKRMSYVQTRLRTFSQAEGQKFQ